MRRGRENASARAPAVAGAFYPADADALRREVSALLGAARPLDLPAPPKALIVPHAGYVYSGAVAAAAYALLRESRRTVRRVVMIGPSHRVPLAGIAVPEADHFLTPLGTIPLDLPLRSELLRRGGIIESDWPHASEHCLEVQLPFLQLILPEFTLLPLVAGAAAPPPVATPRPPPRGGDETRGIGGAALSP